MVGSQVTAMLTAVCNIGGFCKGTKLTQGGSLMLPFQVKAQETCNFCSFIVLQSVLVL